jgi:hypothetical protein
VICSIHQPRADVYFLFDRVTVLSRGALVYAGPGNTTLPHLFAQALPDKRDHCPPLCNIADWVLDVSTIDARDAASEQRSLQRVERLVTHFARMQHEQAEHKHVVTTTVLDPAPATSASASPASASAAAEKKVVEPKAPRKSVLTIPLRREAPFWTALRVRAS